MTQKTMLLFATALFGLSLAAPLQEREVPQEHSHEPVLVSVRKSLAIDNPLGIQDPVFGLLADKGASTGAGKVTNVKCLQRKIADQAFTNAKAAKDIPGMTNALTYAALERNTGSVGKASEACDEPATNPEINALKQHQDPASPGAEADNKAIVLELARQIASVGGDPLDAALSATFAPGKTDDPTAKGNSCDDKDDPNGCIFTKKLLQVEATPDEIKAAVKSGSSSSSSSSSGSSAASSDSTTDSKSNKKAVQKRSNAKRACSAGKNVQTFTGTKGGPPPAVIETPGSSRPFSVAGDTFVGKSVAIQRSCDKQHNACANAANSGAGGSVAECEEQQKQCNAAASTGTKRSVEKRSILSPFSKRAAADLGSCSDPTVEFKEGFDGRKEASFKAVNQKDFNHGSTQKLKITSDFICQRLESSCKASQKIIDSCKSASQAAASLDGQAAADAFNKAFS